eukprot:TRINITY_DN3986_c0_g1_i1.p1 TRINITY_DN3986_c0_g1~~TRINITY_DN3986_c0_g1_i1.p1  ORF type:complete len:157 (+),score=31.92 TRINITY_DN3986_c0_g1_i1:57-527(+)
MMATKIILTLCLIAFAYGKLCGLDVNGKTVDVSKLAALGPQKISAPWNGTNYDFVVQLCGDVESKACTGPAVQIDVTTQECTVLGESRTESWDVDNSNNGIYVTYYHGQAYSPVIHRSARIYFECNSTATDTAPVFEHVTTCGQYHFSWTTPLVCF